ncbi:hypothetical protein GGI25_004361 [Coemansia spiralis]|uniref:Uncharacterized protein n=2 Tax=Coemansia TaxID=4863 RepID=A0A9W8G6T0_9FUNG|nr:hypothetical protein EDC05_003041 [Coemansia umbellata]KAJ2621447.1 hypothetical protein GGI26_004129 [Coemansia sp. RSA 1358]KAJ2674421.1 hypothetical protein GGI25_004361 [Coemansia spiralis]
MPQLSPEQVLAEIKQNGAYDKMRQEILKTFSESKRGKEFESQINSLLESFTKDSEQTRGRDEEEHLERRVLGYLERKGRLQRIEKDARNYWLLMEKREMVENTIKQAIESAYMSESSDRHQHSAKITRPLEVDPPRIPPSHGTGASTRTHNFYRRGDAVAAFLATGDPFCDAQQYICLSVEVISCDAEKSMYTVRDPDSNGTRQNNWVVYWDQIIALKRPYEQKYRDGDQVYALYRDDLGTDAAVSTEFFPGRVEHVGQMSLAIRFDTGELTHVYYDEVFAAGRVGFLRQQSEDRKKRNAPDSMVEVHGRIIPSFTGFWPEIARPGLGNHCRKVRYRQMPPLLVDVHSADRYYTRSQLKIQRIEHPTEDYESEKNSLRQSSDMDTDSSSEALSSPIPSVHTEQHDDNQAPMDLLQQVRHPITEPKANNNSEFNPDHRPVQLQAVHTQPKKPVHPMSSEEDGEIDAEDGEEGECLDEPYVASARTMSVNNRSRGEHTHGPTLRRPSHSRSSSRHENRNLRLDRYSPPRARGSRDGSIQRPSRRDSYYGPSRDRGSDRSPERGRVSRFDNRDQFTRDSHRDRGYYSRRRSRSRSRSGSPNRRYRSSASYNNDQLHRAPHVAHVIPQSQIIINPFRPVAFDMGMDPAATQDQTDIHRSENSPYQSRRHYGSR